LLATVLLACSPQHVTTHPHDLAAVSTVAEADSSDLHRPAYASADGGVGGTGTLPGEPDEGGIGGTGIQPGDPDEGGIGGTGVQSSGTDEGGIGGTGVQAQTVIGIVGIVGIVGRTGTTAALDTIRVGGTEIRHDADTVVRIDDHAVGIEALAIGDVVEVIAADDGSHITARSIVARHAISGPIASTDSADNLIYVLGQTVDITEAVSATGDPLALAKGDFVDIGGLRRNDGTLMASKIAVTPARSSIQLTGPLSVAAPGRLRVGETPVRVEGGSHIATEPDRIARVSGRWDGTTIVAREIQLVPRVPFRGRVDRVEIEGYLRGARPDVRDVDVAVGDFRVRVPETIAGRQLSSIRSDQRVRVNGHVSANRVVADRLSPREDTRRESAPDKGERSHRRAHGKRRTARGGHRGTDRSRSVERGRSDRPGSTDQAEPTERPESPGQPPADEDLGPGSHNQPGDHPNRADRPKRTKGSDRARPGGRADPTEQPPESVDRPEPAQQAEPVDRPEPAQQAEPVDRPEPAQQAEPVDRPEIAEKSDGVEQPELETPEAGDRPDRNESPTGTDRPEPADGPESVEQVEPTDQPQSGDRIEADNQDRPKRARRPGRDGRPRRDHRPGRADRPKRLNRPERAERPTRPEKPDPATRPERADRPHRASRPERAERPDRRPR
jgi:hypothetical protein